MELVGDIRNAVTLRSLAEHRLRQLPPIREIGRNAELREVQFLESSRRVCERKNVGSP